MEPLHEHTQRRNSFRRSLIESGLSPEYLEQLEAKRKALDDSIHRYIASKEREYQAFEKELRHQVKHSSGHVALQTKTDKDISAISAVDTLLRTTSSRKIYEGTSEVDFGPEDGTGNLQSKKEDFPGVFTPKYLTALEHSISVQTASAPAAGATNRHISMSVVRTNSDPAAQTSHPERLPLSQRTSSSGSSIDGRLISALKSTSDVTRSRKRVSLAVGDSIVKPSDNVPVSLTVNSTSSHSRSRTPARQALLDISHSTSDDSTQSGDSKASISAAIQTLQEQGSASAASATDAKRAMISPVQRHDVGDMFDLEEEEMNATYEELPESSPEDYFANETADHMDQTDSRGLDADTGEPPPDDIVHSEPLIFAEGAVATKQPASPGFRRPSAAIDPVYVGRGYTRAEDDAEESNFYGSSYNRDGKGSFTSSSLGESYMARNAEKLMALRAQHQQDRQTTHVMPVR